MLTLINVGSTFICALIIYIPSCLAVNVFVVKSNSSLLSTSSLSNVILELPRVSDNVYGPPLENEALTIVGNATSIISLASTVFTMPDLEITKIESCITSISFSFTVLLTLNVPFTSSIASGLVVPIPTWANDTVDNKTNNKGNIACNFLMIFCFG